MPDKLNFLPSGSEDRKTLLNKITSLVDIRIQTEGLAEEAKDIMKSLTDKEKDGGMNYDSKTIKAWVKYAYDLKYGAKKKIMEHAFEDDKIAEVEILTGIKVSED
ncbi:hypothetical protein [Pseudoalteromonas phage PH357]|nr:hypothetical protein [Pseudoalteromonas phage PH357]